MKTHSIHFGIDKEGYFIRYGSKGKKFYYHNEKEKNKYNNRIKKQIDFDKHKFSGPPVHDYCKCELIDGEWITDPNACDFCLGLASDFNK